MKGSDEGHDFRSKSKFYNVYGICLQSIVSYLSDCMILQVVMDHGFLTGAHILILWTVECLRGHVYVYSAPEQKFCDIGLRIIDTRKVRENGFSTVATGIWT